MDTTVATPSAPDLRLDPVPARLAGVEPAALDWAIEAAHGDWRRLVRRGDGASVAAAPVFFTTALAPAPRAGAQV